MRRKLHCRVLSSNRQYHAHLVTGPPALRDDLGHLVHLSLRTAECPEPLLRKLSRALVLAVAEKFDDAALVWGETAFVLRSVCAQIMCHAFQDSSLNVPRNFLDNVPDECGPLAEVTLHARHTRLGLAWGDFLFIRRSRQRIARVLCLAV